MALAASSPPAGDINMGDSLDEEIAQIRAEIQNLTQQRKLLTSSLLSSTKVQSRLLNATPQAINSSAPLNLTSYQEHSQSNAYRLTFGVTAFPFVDPSPELQSKNPLLGIRFDICDRHGKFESPYYIFCVRTRDTAGEQELRIHRHTIPTLVPLEQYEREYLPPSPSSGENNDDEGYAGSDDAGVDNVGVHKKQDLHALVAKVRFDLVSWRLRQDAADWLQEELGLSRPNDQKNTGENTSNPDSEMRDHAPEDSDPDETIGKYNITSLTPSDVSARQLRLIWSNDRVARLKISNSGKIEKAVVIGEDGTRVRSVERILMGAGEKDGVTVKELLRKLELVYEKSLVPEQQPQQQEEDEEAHEEVSTVQKKPMVKGQRKRKS